MDDIPEDLKEYLQPVEENTINFNRKIEGPPISMDRRSIVHRVDQGIRSWSPDELAGERNLFFKSVLKWLEEWVTEHRERETDIATHEAKNPIRYLISIAGDPGYIVSIHDPMLGGVGGAESMTGADYSVQFPTANGKQKFLYVQAKRDNYPANPKQYFAFGGLYMFLQYLVNDNWWQTRFQQVGDYVTKREKPHREAFFICIYFDGSPVYVPLSSIFRTYDNSTYQILNQLAKKARLWVDKHTAIFVECHDEKQHISRIFESFDDFYLASERCEIGLTHSDAISTSVRKMEGVQFLAEVTMRPNVNIIEADPSMIEKYVDALT